MPTGDTKDTYSNEEFNEWAYRSGLIPEEEFLISTFLEPGKSTLEAGTAGGRILHELNARGYSDLHGYDFVPQFIVSARKRDSSGWIRFDVQDARQLSYADNCFDQVIYLQQILSTLDQTEDRLRATREAWRVLKPSGIALVSFLCWEVRQASRIFKPYILYLRLFRAITGTPRPLQALPWLYVGGKVRKTGAFLDRAPYVYWSRIDEADELLRTAGFRVLKVGSARQIRECRLADSPTELRRASLDGMIYFVCTK